MNTLSKFSIAALGTVVVTLGTSSVAQAANFLATSTGQVGEVDLSTGKFTQVASGPFFYDIAASDDGNLFGVHKSLLYSIDPSSGSSTYLGNSGAWMNSLAFAEDNVLYGAGGSKFYQIDLETTTASLVANIPGFNSVGDLAFDPVNNRFLATSKQNGSDSLFSIPLTGSATKIGDIGFSSIIGLFFDNGTLFGSTGDGKLIAIDPDTGSGSFVKNVTGYTGFLGGAASPPSTGMKEEKVVDIPEPSSLLGLLAFGAVGLTGLKRKKQQKAQNIASND